jgi:hypothetical protein
MNMSIKHILSLTALAGALTTSGIAMADQGHWERQRSSQVRRGDLDVIGVARLNARRGTATFKITPEQRRDGLQLRTDAPGLRVLWIEFEYSDGFVKRTRGVDLGSQYGQLLNIQFGRPPGLRVVRVRYALDNNNDRYNRYGDRSNYRRSARLELIQAHTGSGYTSDEDIREADRDRDRAERREERRERRQYDRDADYDYEWVVRYNNR